jgi:hypothetical protein
VLSRGRLFERGFLSRCSYQPNAPGRASAPEWGTVTHLNLSSTARFGGASDLLSSRGLCALRSVTGVGASDFAAARKENRAFGWRTLELTVGEWEPGLSEQLASFELPELTRLGLLTYSWQPLRSLTMEALLPLLASPLGSALEHLEVAMAPESLGALIELATKKRLTSLTLRPTARELCLRFEPIPRALMVDLPADGRSAERLLAAVRSLKPATVDRVLVKVPRKVKIVGDEVIADYEKVSLLPLKRALGDIELVLSQ